MSKIREFDVAIIERGAQPVADFLSRWVDNFAIARFFLVGSLLIACVRAWASIVLDHKPIDGAVGLLGFAALFFLLKSAFRDAEKRPRSTMNPLRNRYFPSRMIILGFTVLDAVYLLAGDFAHAAFIENVQLVLSVYFAACEDSPPRQQSRQESPWGAFVPQPSH